MSVYLVIWGKNFDGEISCFPQCKKDKTNNISPILSFCMFQYCKAVDKHWSKHLKSLFCINSQGANLKNLLEKKMGSCSFKNWCFRVGHVLRFCTKAFHILLSTPVSKTSFRFLNTAIENCYWVTFSPPVEMLDWN